MSLETGEIFEFGEHRLDVDRRLVLSRGEPVALPPKTFELLLLFVRNPGRAFSKRELMSTLWPDTFVEEANLTFQISTLRKALGGGAPAWIETIPKHGYRFSEDVRSIGPSSAAEREPGPPTRVQSVTARPTRIDWRWIALGTSVVAIGLSIYAIVSRRGDRVSVRPDIQARAVPLTTYEGRELNPSLSPDGSQVAFSWNGSTQENEDIYVKLVGPGEPHQLTTHPARDSSPAWSPDGRRIAFLRWTAQNDSDVDVILVPALGNAAERRIASVKIRPTRRPLSRLAWTPDGRWLAIPAEVSPRERHGIWLLSADGGEPRRLTESAGPESGVLGDAIPAFSSDGRRLAFTREVSAGVDSIHILALSADMTPAGTALAITDASPPSGIPGLAWTENDSSLVFSAASFLAAQSRLHRVPLTSDRLHAAGAPRALPFGDQATSLTVSRSGRLVYSAVSRDSALWRLDLGRGGADPRPTGIPGSTLDEHTPSYSRDGKRIAFASTRSGTEELWVAKTDGTALRQVTFIGGPQCANPQWSPTSDDIILFNSRLHGSSDLFLLDLSSGRYDRLTIDPADDVEARWSRDGTSIYFGSNREGGADLWKMPATGGPAERVTRDGGIAGMEAMDGFIYYAKTPRSPTSVWRVPVSGGEETLVVDGLSYSSNFAVGRTGLYFMSRGGRVTDTAIEYFDLASRRRTRLASIGKQWWFGMALSPDEKSLLYSVVENVSSNLMLVEKAW